MTEEKRSAEETLRRAREQQQGKPDDAMGLEELRQATGAEKLEVLDKKGKVLETVEGPPEETEIERAMRLVKEKKQAEGSVIDLPPEMLQHKAAQVQQQQQKQVSARLGLLMDGKEKPKNEVVEYFLDRLRDGRQEFQVTQTNIQEVSNRLKQLQARALQIQGEQNKRVEDIVAWWDRDMKTNAGEGPPDKGEDDLVKGE